MTDSVYNFGRYERICDVGLSARRLLKRTLLIGGALLLVEYGVLVTSGSRGATAFALISAGSMAVLAWWAESGESLPVIPMLALQNLLAYGLPIVTHNESAMRYPSGEVTSAGLEVFIASIAMIVSWRVAMEIIPPGSGMCYALQGLKERSSQLRRLGFSLVIGSTVYEALRSSGLVDVWFAMLPAGSEPILHVLVSAASACGFFITGMTVGRGEATGAQTALFWGCLAIQAFISAAGFLLSPALTVIFAALIGLFWGSGRIPWKYLIVVLLLLAFFNLGKFTMRTKYWGTEGIEDAPQITLAEMPHYYSQWTDASLAALTPDRSGPSAELNVPGLDDPTGSAGKNDQSLLQRINNLQNLLYVVDVMDHSRVKPLDGATYTLIPPLLIPRILWPNKPRTHEGQVLLNVHFGRQDLRATFETYIAWGLLPEAYGNYGPKTGAIVLGIFLGVIFAWVERFLARKLVLSMEGFLAFTVLLGMANSYEMVASVLVTSVFQACVPIVLATAPFVQRVSARN